MLTDVQIDTTLKTTFANDEVAKRYLNAARNVINLPFDRCPPEDWALIREWCLEAEKILGNFGEDAEHHTLLMMSTVAPTRILLGVVDHFGM